LSDEENEVRLRQTLEYLISSGVTKESVLVGLGGSNGSSGTGQINLDGLGTVGNVQDSPQLRAARWISTLDRRTLPIPKPKNDSNSGLFDGTNPNSTPQYDKHEYPFLQRYALATLYFSTGGGDDQWIFTTGFLSSWHECVWFDIFDIEGMASDPNTRFVFGVVCDGGPNLSDGEEEEDLVGGKQWVVTHVSLPPLNNMVGTLCPELKVLRYLKELHVQLNMDVTGTIPSEYGSLINLNTLVLAYNALTGEIPKEISNMKNLEVLQLEQNVLSGDINFAMTMSKLKELSVEYNPNITGTIPESILALQNLSILSLSNTDMYGTLPSGMSQLENLELLLLDDSNFSGSVEVLQNLTNLRYLYLEDNRFNDTIDDNFLKELDQLVHLDISANDFRGSSIPAHLFGFPDLKVLDMSSNHRMQGSLPAEAIANAKGSKLEHLSLHSMNITGQIPLGISALKNLTHLDLSLNRLYGDIPPELAELTKLQYLFLGRNNFSAGAVPEWLRNLTKLTELSLKASSLTGIIPDWIGTDLSKLKFLDFGENSLEGPLPESVGTLSNLWILILNKNNLNGTIPLSFGQLKSLETFLIDDNQFEGNADIICARKDKIEYFIADCASNPETSSDVVEIRCDCCTLCCHDQNATCNDAEWLGNQESIWENGYGRVKWEFEAGEISLLND